ncbi:MAG: 3-deoxy-D-manno-octulosonic acid transferase, partial [Acidobacteriaceae bacterium]|nr:3-deoxy-D-manno-octulosonic acid transferase [Acidobacteriaceae bacterium]
PERVAARPGTPHIWVHAVSVGEVRAVSEFVSKLESLFPEHRVVVSTTTGTGQKLAQKTFGREKVFYFPLDFAFAIRPYLRALRPELVVLAETEFWPNFLRLAHASGARVAVVNARISDRSWPRYLRFGFLYQRVLRDIDLFMSQTEEDAKRLREIGAPADRVLVSGNLKFDVPTPPAPPVVASLRMSFQECGAGPVIVCGSTVDEEEPILLRAFENVLASYPRAVMILAPRHPERFSAVAELLEKLGIRYWRRSLWSGDPIAGGVLLIDSIGELAALYSLADVAFVGGSLVPRGGHNIIEPAQYGVAVLVGPHNENFRDIIRVFQSRRAVRVVNPVELPLVLMELISNAAEREALGRRAAETLHSQTGASERTAEALKSLLQPISSPAGTLR